MRHRDFHALCARFDWGWRDSKDPKVRNEAFVEEHRLRRVARETSSLERILVRAEASYWRQKVRSTREAQQ